MTNATGLWGSNDAEPRCTDEVGWVEEISSLSWQHLILAHGGALWTTPGLCTRCSKKLGRTLPPTCVRSLIHKATKQIWVPCADMARELVGVANVTLLQIDAESHDVDVLREYPWSISRPWRVSFEAGFDRSKFEEAVSILRTQGYAHVSGSLGAPLSIWHRVDDSSEPLVVHAAERNSK